MLATETKRTSGQASRAYEELRKALVDWFNLDAGGHLSPPEDKLGTQKIKQEDASFEGSSILRMDAEKALLRCGASFKEKMVTFQFLTYKSRKGGVLFPHGGTYRARNGVGKRFDMTPARVADMADRTLDCMVEYLTGFRP